MSIATVALLAYGYLCRLIGIYFFWESKSIGWMLLWVAIIMMLVERIRHKKMQNQRSVAEKIGIGFSIFILLIKSVLFVLVPQSSAYNSASEFISTNPDIQQRVGKVDGIFLVPFGSISSYSNPEGTAGQADLHFVVKGDKRYEDLNLRMNKELDQHWQIEEAGH